MSALVMKLKNLGRDEIRFREAYVIFFMIAIAVLVGQRLPTRWQFAFAGLGACITLFLMLRSQLMGLVFVLFVSSVHFFVKAVILNWHPASAVLKEGLLLLLLGFFVIEYITSRGKLERSPLTAPFVALAVLATVQCFNPNTYNWMAALDDYRFWISPLVIYFLATNLIKTRHALELSLKVVFLYALLEAAYGCIQPFLPQMLLVKLGADPASYWYFHQGSTRAFSTMGTAPFAVFAAMFPTIAFFYMSQQREDIKRWAYAGMGFVFVLGSLFTLVRTGWVALMAAMLAYALLTRRTWILVLLLSVGILAMTFASGYMQYKVEGLLNPEEDLSVQTRIDVARYLSDAVTFRVFGYGMGTVAQNRYARMAGIEDKTGYGISTENYYLMMVLELGWLGGLIMLWMFFKIYKLGLTQWRGLKSYRYRELSIALVCSLFAIEVGRMGGPVGYYPPESWHYWFFVALLVLLPKFDDEVADEEQGLAPQPAELPID